MNQRTWLWPLIAIALVIVLLSTVDSGDWIGLLVPVLVGVAYYIAVEGGRRMGIPIGRARADRLLAFLAMAAIFLT
ncbi:MAG: hypothetical protein HY873_10975, partial [Chloroflexi bacterium]|nr:hypothetical protein [Chloroflexota bacterium]